MSSIYRSIETQKDKDHYAALCRYAFRDDIGWVDLVFPLEEGSTLLGYFKDSQLRSAVSSRLLFSNLLGKMQPISGISMVATYPEGRNQGHVKTLMEKILVSEKEKGRLASFLYPFKFPFYQKLGYGYAGGSQGFRVLPEDLIPKEGEGSLRQFQGDPVDLKNALALRKIWIRHFEGGIYPDKWDLESWQKFIEKDKNRYVYFLEQEGEMRGYVDFSLVPEGGAFGRRMEVHGLVWRGPGSLEALIGFLRSHRDQIRFIKFYLPRAFPFHLLTRSVRMHSPVEFYEEYMFRALDLPQLMEEKIQATAFQGNFGFTVEDPIIAENTGTYLIKKGKLEKSAPGAAPFISLDVLSSLILGAMDIKQARWAGMLSKDFPDPEGGELFPLKPNIYLGKHF